LIIVGHLSKLRLPFSFGEGAGVEVIKARVFRSALDVPITH